MGFSSLPREVLREIICRTSPSITDLRNYILVSRNMWEIGSAIMYSHIDLQIDARYDEGANKKTKLRQLMLLRSIASSPRIGANVRTFKNYHPWPGAGRRENQDVTMRTEEGIPGVLVTAAQNMRFLSMASFTANPLGIEVITNLPSYHHLTDLSITRVDAEQHIWDIYPLSLRKLKWEVPSRWGGQDQNPWDTAAFLIKVAEATCPDLESLDISFCDQYGFRPPTIPAVSAGIINQYREKKSSTTPKLTRLRKFWFHYQDASTEQQNALENLFLEFVALYSKSLESVSIPIPHGAMTRNTLDFILKACGSLPNLTDLVLDEKKVGTGRGSEQMGLQFIRELMLKLASPRFEIERLSIGNIEVPFSPEVGNLFTSMRSLKFLRVGDKDGSEGPYGHDGRLDFRSYGPEILRFIKNLPQSLEEIYLEINGQDVWCDEDSDFDPVCDLGSEIFSSMKRLHTCDIHAWITNVGGGLGQIPEKGVFYRRLAQSEYSKANTKDIWTSRMDSVYQQYFPIVVNYCDELEGDFDGVDADEAWCGGYTFEMPEPSDFSWPRWVNIVNTYTMFNSKS